MVSSFLPQQQIPLEGGQHGARTYVKRPVALTVVFARQAGTVSTLEGPVACAVGDAVVTGTHGEQWPVPKAAFGQRYAPVAPTVEGCDGLYQARPVPVLAMQLVRPVDVVLPVGKGVLQGAKGDWLVQYAPGNQAIVKNGIFNETYERA